jgi:D-alanyl-D-alanine carboxypeptidase
MFPASRRPLARLGVTTLAALASFSVVCSPLAEGAVPGGALQAGLHQLATKDGFPAALGSIRDSNGKTRNYVAGFGDLKGKTKVPVDGQVRIASASKMFTSTVVLQLVGEGKIDLDAPVEQYLPGVVRGDGIDGRNITVHQLLQHTSGLPDYTQIAVDFLKIQHTYLEPNELLDIAFTQKAVEAPGFPPNWQYGLGLMKITLSCGDVVYGHGGDIPGTETRDAITADGKAVTISVTALPTQKQGESQPMPVDKVLDDVLCD